MNQGGAAEAFIVIAFPAKPDRKATQAQRLAAIGEVAGRLKSELTAACGETPHPLSNDATAICLLVFGQFGRISRAVEAARAMDTRTFIARISTPTESTGLATAHQWIEAHAPQH